MKKFLLALLLLTSVFAVAAGTDYVQFTSDDFNVVRRPSQNWFSAEMISLDVKAGSTVYIMNYISNFDKVYDLDDKNYSIYNPTTGKNEKPGFDMSTNKYGYMVATTDADGNVISVGDVIDGKGHTRDFTFNSTDPNDSRTVTTAGYELGTFTEDTKIFFVMTPVSNGDPMETVNSYDPVGGYLTSRQNNTVDALGQIRVNFGTSDGVGHEFVVGYVAKEDMPPSGQPLPGVLTSCLVGLAATSIAARRKRSRK